MVATKFGRRVELDPALYTYENLRAWLERSRENLGVEAVDLVQLHCPPRETYYLPEVHEACDRLVQEGLVRAYGVSVEKVEDALKAIEFEGVATIQLIFNMLRQRPGALFDQARRRDIGARPRPARPGLLTRKFDRTRRRGGRPPQFNRHGQEFDVGETFSGVTMNRARRGEVKPPSLRVRRWPSRAALGPHVRRGFDGHPRREDAGAHVKRRCRRQPAPSPRRWTDRNHRQRVLCSCTSAGTVTQARVVRAVDEATYSVVSRPARSA